MRAWAKAVGVLAACGLLAACGQFDQQAQLKVAASEIQADMRTANSARPDEVPQINPESQAKGDAGRLSKAFKGFIIKAFQDRKAYADAVKAAGVEAKTSPQALSQADGFADARAALSRVDAAITQYAAANEKNVASFRHTMTTFPPVLRTSFEAGFQRSLAEEGGVNAMMTYERKVLKAYSAMLDDLERTRGHWKASGSNFMFSRTEDLMSFQSHQMAIRTAVMEEQTAQMAARVRQSGRVERMSTP